jgi:tetratricopeptide (TPR) repeat protein
LIPVRHSLGALLMRSGRFADAEEVYREDLKCIPDNGWSLFGLAESLRALKKDPEEMAATKAKVDKIWAKADLKIHSSCLCQPRT